MLGPVLIFVFVMLCAIRMDRFTKSAMSNDKVREVAGTYAHKAVRKWFGF